MNRISASLAAAVLLSGFTSQALAAWYFIEHFGNSPRQTISDATQTFEVDDINCTAEETSFLRAPDDSILESRSLQCQLSEDTFVSVRVTCNLPLYEVQSLSITIADKMYYPALMCGPK